MTIHDLLREARDIWGEERLTLGQVIVRLGVDFGKLCRFERNADKDRSTHTEETLKTELGNILFSMIRWTNDLGFDPEECIKLAKEKQAQFAKENTHR